MLGSSTYHSILRISGLVLALVMVFDGGWFGDVTSKLSERAGYYVANSVGVSVGVAPNGINQITAALTEKEFQLQQREAAIRDREIEIGLQPGVGGTAFDRSTFVLAALVFIVLVLMILNYILDYVRYREQKNLVVQTPASM